MIKWWWTILLGFPVLIEFMYTNKFVKFQIYESSIKSPIKKVKKVNESTII